MSTPNIEELRQLAQAATPGIWCHVQRGISRWHGERIEADLNPICDFAMLQDCCVHEYDRAYGNAAYIQAANPAAIISLIDTIQAQAERVKALELDLDAQAGSIEAVQAVNARQAERIKALEGQLAALEADYAETRDDLQEANDTLASTYHILGERDAQLAEIEKAEPVIWAISYDGVTPYTLWHEGDGALLDLEVKRQGGTTQKMPLFTHPMPVQPIVGLQAIHDAITVDPTLADCSQSAEHCLWACNGHEPCQHVKPAQDVTELVEAFGKLYKKYVNLLESGRDRILDLGGSCDPVDVMEMSDPGLRDARTALSKYKGAK